MNLIQKKSKNAELNVEINSYFDNKQNMGFEKEQIVRKTVCEEDKRADSTLRGGQLRKRISINQSGFYLCFLQKQNSNTG